MNPNINQPVKTFASVEALSVYPANVLPQNKNVVVYFGDNSSQIMNYSSVSNQVSSLTAQLALLTAIKSGIAAALDITA